MASAGASNKGLPANQVINYAQSVVGEGYLVLGVLATGGTAYVCEALDRTRNIKVAVKVVREDASIPAARDRLRLEIRVAQGIGHPHVIPILNAVHDCDQPWMAMPVASDRHLKSQMETRVGGLPLGTCVQAMRAIAGGLSALHGAGYIHRDVSPENVLCSGGHLWLADFGLIRSLGEARKPEGVKLTPEGQWMGRPEYAPPEQLMCGPLDQRSDLYSLGVVSYEMLTGDLPIQTNRPDSILNLKLNPANIIRVESRRAPVPTRLADLVHKCLEPGQGERPESAMELVAEIDDIIQAGLLGLRRSGPPHPRGPDWTSRIRRMFGFYRAEQDDAPES